MVKTWQKVDVLFGSGSPSTLFTYFYDTVAHVRRVSANFWQMGARAVCLSVFAGCRQRLGEHFIISVCNFASLCLARLDANCYFCSAATPLHRPLRPLRGLRASSRRCVMFHWPASLGTPRVTAAGAVLAAESKSRTEMIVYN